MITDWQPSQTRGAKSGILFDLDGVLWDSATAHAEAFRCALAEAGLPAPEDYAAIAGMKTEEALVVHLERCGIPADAAPVRFLAGRKREFARLFLKESARPAPGLPETLHRLASRYRLALCSSASPGTVACFMEKTGLFPLFAAVLDATSVERAKPAPDIYLLGARRLHLSAAEVVVIEDSQAGVAAARAAGMDVIGVGADAEMLKGWGCVAVVPDIRALPQLLTCQLHMAKD